MFVAKGIFAQDLSICNWKSDRKAAVVLTFDDWLKGHGDIVVPMLIKKNIPATFFITLNNVHRNGVKQLNLAQSSDVEIANHTVTHPDLTAIPFKKAKTEIKTTRNFILDSVANGRSLTFAYPLGTKNPEIINYLKRHHIGARGVSSANEDDIKYDFVVTEDDYYRIKTVRVWRILSSSKVGEWLGYAKKGGGLLTFMIHSIYNDSIKKGWDGMPEQFLSKMLDTLNSHKKDLWICTFEDAIQYHKEKANATIKILSQSKNKLSFSVRHFLDEKKYDQDLTVKIKLNGREVMSVYQAGRNLNFVSDIKDLLVDVAPFGQKVIVKFK